MESLLAAANSSGSSQQAMDLLRGRCGAVSPRAQDHLPVTYVKPWKHMRHPPRYSMRSSAGSSSSGSHGMAFTRRSARRLLLGALAAVLLMRLGAHLFSAPVPELEDLMRLDGDGPSVPATWRSNPASHQPKLIPRFIHQTLAGGTPPAAIRQYMASWRRLNPGWEVRVYTDQDCLEFVRREFPEYLEAYRRLAKGVERADFFRYMVILHSGGVYADVDAECKQPLDSVLHSKDTLVAGWDNDFADAQAALEAGYVRMRQLGQWVFAGAPGHPALKELCDRIAAGVDQHQSFSLDSRINTLERTGAGLFTDVLLRHAAQHPPSNRDDPWGVRLLPRVLFGAPQKPAFGLAPTDPGVAVMHHTVGVWHHGSPWSWQQVTMQDVTSEVARRWRHRSEDAWVEQAKIMQARDEANQLYPVSVDFDPPFDLLTYGAGRGERQSGADVSAAITTHGSWQPSVQPSRRPSLADALVGSMGGADSRQNVLVDVGAGYGLLSLAAAARGHRVHAFELGPASLEALEGSVAHNGFEHLVQVHKEPLGSLEQEGYTCILPRQTSSSSGGLAAADVEVQRGYGPAEVHSMPAESCQLMTRRSAGAWVVPETDQIAALRVSANGWEGFVLKGFAPLLERPNRPPVIAVEWNPEAMKAAGWKSPLKLVEWLYALGYHDISHSGYVCDERWYSITYGIRRRGGITPEDLAGLRQPTWCRLLPEHFSLLLDRTSGAYPETLLFVNRAAAVANASSSSNSTAPGGESGGRSSGGTDEYGVPDVVAQALAEAALMVADPAANHTAAAVSDLAAASGDGSQGAADKQPNALGRQRQQQHQQQRQQPTSEGGQQAAAGNQR